MNPPSSQKEYFKDSAPVKLTPQQIQADTHRLRLERAQQIAQDDLRRRIIEQVPEIRHEVDRMENVLRELVDFERSKLPPAHNFGYLILKANKAKKKLSDPDIVGNARIGDKNFKATGYSNTDPIGEKFLKVTLQPR